MVHQNITATKKCSSASGPHVVDCRLQQVAAVAAVAAVSRTPLVIVDCCYTWVIKILQHEVISRKPLVFFVINHWWVGYTFVNWGLCGNMFGIQSHIASINQSINQFIRDSLSAVYNIYSILDISNYHKWILKKPRLIREGYILTNEH